MTHALTDKTGNTHSIDEISLAGRSTVVQPQDVVVSFICDHELALGEYDIKPSLPHPTLKVITRVRITNKTNRGGGRWLYQTQGTR